MRKWVKRSILGLLLVAFAAAGLGYWLFRGTPEWYRPAALSAQERTAAAERAEGKVRATYNFAAKLQADEQKRIYAAGANSTRPATATAPSSSAFTVAFTEDELNAFFDKWSTHYNWSAAYAPYVSDPAIVLRDGKLILAGTLAEIRTVTSVHFRPIIQNGRLSLVLENVYAGRLPMPDVVWDKQRERALAGLRQKLPAWQRDAQIAPNGTANAAAVSAGMGKLLLDVLSERPAEPVLFLPVERGAVPVRLTSASVENRELTMTVEPMTSAERAALLQRIGGPEGRAVTASGH